MVTGPGRKYLRIVEFWGGICYANVEYMGGRYINLSTRAVHGGRRSALGSSIIRSFEGVAYIVLCRITKRIRQNRRLLQDY